MLGRDALFQLAEDGEGMMVPVIDHGSAQRRHQMTPEPVSDS